MDYTLAPEELTQTWIDFREAGSQDARNSLVLHYYKRIVLPMAGKIATQLPKMIDRDDLASYGLFGLMECIEKFDPERGVKFETYSGRRIRGSIFDEIRDLDWAPRNVWAKARDVDRVQTELHSELGRKPEDQEVADRLKIGLVDLWAVQSRAHAGQVGYYDAGSEGYSALSMIFDPSSNPADLYESSVEVSQLLAGAISSMPQRFKTILVLYYLHDMTLAEVGEILGVTESRACQLQSNLLRMLHNSLSQGLAAVA